MNSNKSLFLFILLFLGPLVRPVHAAVLTDSFHKEISELAELTTITLDNVNGDCHFFLAPKQNKLAINATITVKGSSDEACESYYQKVRIEVSRANHVLKIRVNHPHSSSFFGLGNSTRLSVDFEISIPVSMDVSVNLVNGNVHVEKMKVGRVEIVNGKVKMEGVIGASVEAVNSCVQISGLKEWTVVNAVNGSLKLASVSSDLKKIKVEFVNGSITVDIPASCLGELKMDSATGTVMLKEKTGVKNWKTRVRGKKIHISDKGQAEIYLENVNGRITLLCN